MFSLLFPLIFLYFMFAIILFFAITYKDISIIIICICFGIATILFTLQEIKMFKKDHNIKIKHDINYPVILFGLIIYGFSIFTSYLLYKNINLKIKGIKTTAEIYDIVKERKTDNEGNVTYTCYNYIKYNVNNVEYKNKSDDTNCKYNTGDKIDIYYDKDNPNKFVSQKTWIFVFATGFSYMVSIIYSAALLNTKSTKKSKKKSSK